MPYAEQVEVISPVDAVLIQAAEYLRQGWCQSRYHDEQGNVCIYGAINKVVLGVPNTSRFIGVNTEKYKLIGDIHRKITKQITKTVGHFMGISEWNDSPLRTQKQAAELLDKAAGVPS